MFFFFSLVFGATFFFFSCVWCHILLLFLCLVPHSSSFLVFGATFLCLVPHSSSFLVFGATFFFSCVGATFFFSCVGSLVPHSSFLVLGPLLTQFVADAMYISHCVLLQCAAMCCTTCMHSFTKGTK